VARAEAGTLCDRVPPVSQEWLDVNGQLVAWGGTIGGRWTMHWPGLGTFQFGPVGDVEVFPAAGAAPAALQDSFVRGVLPVVLVGRGHEALHASAVRQSGHLTLFCARSGVGKSSLALGLAARGGEHWADDTVVLSDLDGVPHALSLPFPPRVDGSALHALGLQGRTVPSTKPGETTPLARIYLLARDPTLDPAHPVIEAVAPAPLFEGLAAHAHPFELAGPDRRRHMIEQLLNLAGRVRGWRVRFAPSLAALPTLVDTVAHHIDIG
jgi:hypothetical protein